MAGKQKLATIPSTIDIVVDLGNALLKGMMHGRRNSAVVIPHAIKKVSPEKFEQIVKRHKNGYQRGAKDVDVSMFGYKGQYAIVGENAENQGEDDRRSGGPKYQPDYYPFLLISVLMNLIPQGHENIRLMAMFPPGDIRFTDDLMNSLGGKHVVDRVDGSQVVYKVRSVLTVDEPVAGLRNFLLAENGRQYRQRHIGNGLGLCVDIGGKISSLVPFRADGWVDHNSAKTIDLGIQNVMKGVSDILLSTAEYQPFFEGVRGDLPFDDLMRECVRTGIYPTGGYELNALDAIADATAAIRSRIRNVYLQDLGGARRYSYVVITGGGGGALFPQMVEHVLNFNPERVFPAAPDPEQMHLANLFGADNTLTAMHVEGRV